VGKTLSDIKRDITQAIQTYKESCAELGVEPSSLVKGEYELSFVIDATTFINYYSSIFTKAALSRITGINERQLWHYAAGLHKPRKKQLERIQRGVQTLTEELKSICLL
jgi:ubiquinone biosynthesis protein UbiJ